MGDTPVAVALRDEYSRTVITEEGVQNSTVERVTTTDDRGFRRRRGYN